jgi:flagellar biosynthesis GTPase FlhF
MRLKSYYAGTVEGAIAQARQELGDDVMLIHSRRTVAEFCHLGSYEVVFAIGAEVIAKPPETWEVAQEAPVLPPKTTLRHPQTDFALAQMRKELVKLAVSLEDSAGGLPFDKVAQLLTEQGVAAEPLFELLRELKRQMAYGSGSEEKMWTVLSQEMEHRVRVDASMSTAADSVKIAAVVGPPGSGKTTTLIKLAARFGLGSRKPCLLLSADNYKIGSSDQLRSYAAILGAAFDTAITPAALAQRIEEHRHKSLILIDTPGLSGEEMEEHEEWARFFASREDIEKHLVLSASMKNADLSFVVDRYRVFGPNRLLFTKLDETATQGAIWNEAVRTGLPLSYWTAGQKIPEDLEEASKTQLLDSILKQANRQLSATAGA